MSADEPLLSVAVFSSEPNAACVFSDEDVLSTSVADGVLTVVCQWKGDRVTYRFPLCNVSYWTEERDE